MDNAADVDGSNRRDRLSELPDGLISHILSFVPIQDVVKTSVLSSRWRDPWIHILYNSVLDVRATSLHQTDWRRLSSFCEFMDQAAERVKMLKGFNLHIGDNHIESTAINSWIRKLVVEHEVENLSLNLCLYELPGFMFDLSRLESLHIAGCILPNPFPKVRWPRLKELSIGGKVPSVELRIGDILSGSPALDRLKLENCHISRVESANLKELVIQSPQMTCRRRLEIIAQSLLVLRVRGCWLQRDCMGLLKLTNVSSLVEAELDFFVHTNVDYDVILCSNIYGTLLDNLEDVLDKLKHVTTLRIGDRCLPLVANTKETTGRVEFAKWKRLIIESKRGGVNPVGIIRLLDRAPHLDSIELTGFRLDAANRYHQEADNTGKRQLCKALPSELETVVQRLVEKLKYVQTAVLRWSDAAGTGQTQLTVKSYDLGKKQGKEHEEMVLSVAQQMSSHWGLYFEPWFNRQCDVIYQVALKALSRCRC